MLRANSEPEPAGLKNQKRRRTNNNSEPAEASASFNMDTLTEVKDDATRPGSADTGSNTDQSEARSGQPSESEGQQKTIHKLIEIFNLHGDVLVTIERAEEAEPLTIDAIKDKYLRAATSRAPWEWFLVSQGETPVEDFVLDERFEKFEPLPYDFSQLHALVKDGVEEAHAFLHECGYSTKDDDSWDRVFKEYTIARFEGRTFNYMQRVRELTLLGRLNVFREKFGLDFGLEDRDVLLAMPERRSSSNNGGGPLFFACPKLRGDRDFVRRMFHEGLARGMIRERRKAASTLGQCVAPAQPFI